MSEWPFDLEPAAPARRGPCPDAGEFDDETWYNEQAGEVLLGAVLIDCPTCGHRCRPFRAKATEETASGWRWVGLDYREPYSDYQSRCGKCRTAFRFRMVSPV